MSYPKWVTERFGKDVPEWVKKRFKSDPEYSYWSNGSKDSESQKIFDSINVGDILTGYVTGAFMFHGIHLSLIKGRKPVSGICVLCSDQTSEKYYPFETVAFKVFAKGNDNTTIYGELVSKSL